MPSSIHYLRQLRRRSALAWRVYAEYSPIERSLDARLTHIGYGVDNRMTVWPLRRSREPKPSGLGMVSLLFSCPPNSWNVPACYVICLLFSTRKLGVHFTSSGRPLNTRGGPEYRAAVPTLTSHVSTRAFRNQRPRLRLLRLAVAMAGQGQTESPSRQLL